MFVKQIALPVSRTKSLNQIIRNIFISVPCNTIKSSNFNATQIANISNQVNYSRFSATTIMTGTDLFKISDYDYVGFDLDNTLLQYKVRILMISLCIDQDWVIIEPFVMLARVGERYIQIFRLGYLLTKIAFNNNTKWLLTSQIIFKVSLNPMTFAKKKDETFNLRICEKNKFCLSLSLGFAPFCFLFLIAKNRLLLQCYWWPLVFWNVCR